MQVLLSRLPRLRHRAEELVGRLEGRQAESAPSVWPVLMADGELDSYEKYVARTSKLVPFLG